MSSFRQSATATHFEPELVRSAGFAVALVLAGLLLVPNLLWEATHGWTSVHFFLHPPPSATQESRPQYVANLLLLTHPVAVPVAVAGLQLPLDSLGSAARRH